MSSGAAGRSSADLWSEIAAVDEGEEQERLRQQQQQGPGKQAVYRRRKQERVGKQNVATGKNVVNVARVSFAGNGKRVSWNRSLSTRGRTSIAVTACVDHRPEQKHARRKAKPPLPKAKVVHSFEKERSYFQEVDAFDLLEESPSPKKSATWVVGNQTESFVIPHLSSRLEKWLISKKLNHGCGPSSTLSKILETPAMFSGATLETPSGSLLQINSSMCPSLICKNDLERHGHSQLGKQELKDVTDESCKDLEAAVRKLSLTSTCDTSDGDNWNPFAALLAVCGQTAPSNLVDVFSKFCAPDNIIKIGEGTFGEAFKAGNYVCKVVPIDGDLRVNGEVQKRSEELLEEAVLSQTLNRLRECKDDADNACTTFIQTIDLRLCQGPYDVELIRAWEDWDEKNGSENDHPKAFPEKQCYMVFVLEHGGKDLESFVLLNFDEARSLLVQVTAALAVAEAAYEFEHRDLHWGNILLSRNDSRMLKFTLEGRHINVKTFGLCISIIDFTLSRINTGQDILFLDLSSDPYLFKGPKGDKQSETYRKMKEVTEDYWEGSFPKTNVLWLVYLIDILLLKKSFERSSKDERELRSLKKHLDKYGSAKEAISDPFFADLFVDSVV
ncbi:serine/threonine-protein kinase haspin homolog isoform X2 [Syzygium oleosum]|uniref:serine/threonine-protein kinase haspin homolog isoform X2 n=1 Tax=Syzygium oleosum TaxID=219896 RepID=UPI0011D22EAA|nr:serine/threonine-protein kinase haspin homolog isoform X2 [Syzygium oleosum]